MVERSCLRRTSTLTFKTQDIFSSTLVGPGFAIAGPSTNLTVTDGVIPDEPAPLDGQTKVVLRGSPGAYSWCETTAPRKMISSR